MENTSENKSQNHICIGMLAHVDAGKTTLVESMLYKSGAIKSPGRVDHKDTFLDNNEIERERGITIFSKQADVMIGDKLITLIDTPGHVDFSAETQRAMQIMDYGILIISAGEGIQSHVRTLWKLLSLYKVPVFIFVNKMDMPDTDMGVLMENIRNELGTNCICFEDEGSSSFYEEAATSSENALEEYLETGKLSSGTIAENIKNRLIFPCFFGSALKLTGVDNFMRKLAGYIKSPDYSKDFGAKIYKISRDDKGVRLTHMKITGGILKNKMIINNHKVDQIRIYAGSSYKAVNEAYPGDICAVAGLDGSRAGEGIGIEKNSEESLYTPVLVYRIILPDGVNVHTAFMKFKELEEEEPELNFIWNESSDEINVRLMGEIQTEVLKRIIRERYDISIEFGKGSIVYKETIAAPVVGVGHYEPLRHYAEAHILMEPAERGSGIQVESDCDDEMLATNWQRLIMTHLEEKKHIGVLTGSEITDIKMTLIAGRAHLKHTEGGDFRQAVYRAVRQGLMKAESVLLEPVYSFRLELPKECVGRAVNDIQRMNGRVEETIVENDKTVLTGVAPVVCIQDYQTEVSSYTKGLGMLNCTLCGYEECHNSEQVIEETAYDAQGDIANPSASIFCSHGAGFYVSWEQVEDYMHISGIKEKYTPDEDIGAISAKRAVVSEADDDELEDIFVRTYGQIKRRNPNVPKKISYNNPGDEKYIKKKQQKLANKKKDNYLLVDGYNIIFAWKDLKELAKDNMESARVKLMDILCNYQGYMQTTVILVFDAYKVKGNHGDIEKYNNIYVVYTKEAETADQYIEKTVHKIAKDNNVTVATSDALEQIIIFGHGAVRLSAQGFAEEVRRVEEEMRGNYLS